MALGADMRRRTDLLFDKWIGRGRDARAAGLGVWAWCLGIGFGRWSVVHEAHLFDDDVTKCARDLNFRVTFPG